MFLHPFSNLANGVSDKTVISTSYYSSLIPIINLARIEIRISSDSRETKKREGKHFIRVVIAAQTSLPTFANMFSSLTSRSKSGKSRVAKQSTVPEHPEHPPGNSSNQAGKLPRAPAASTFLKYFVFPYLIRTEACSDKLRLWRIDTRC